MKSALTRIALILALALVSFAGGYLAKGQAVANERVNAANVSLQHSAKNAERSVSKSVEIESSVEKTASSIESIKSASSRAGVTLYKNGKHHDPEPTWNTDRDATPSALGSDAVCKTADPDGGSYLLDERTVWLLNAARQGRGVDSTGSGDEAQPAPSSVELTHFISNDLDVIRMYLDLAKRHDELVDAVEKKLKDQSR